MNHTDYLLHLDRKGVEMGVNDDGALRAGPPTKLTPEDRTYIIANKTSLLADMVERDDMLTVAYESIGKACEWLALETVLARGLEIWSKGIISTTDYERVAVACADQARTIPCSWEGEIPAEVTAPIKAAQQTAIAFDGDITIVPARQPSTP